MNAKDLKLIKIRLYCVFAVFVLVFGAIIYRAFDLQVINRENLLIKANNEIERNLRLGAVRGDIYDINGEKLALSLAVDSVFIDTKLLKDKGEAARLLAETLSLDFDFLANKLSKSDNFVWVKRQITPEESENVKNLNIKGIGLVKEHKRAYPNNSLAAHVLGFVGIDGEGLEGLERNLDAHLKAGQEYIKVKRDAKGGTMMATEGNNFELQKGNSVVLTIDRRIQFIAEKSLAKAIENYKAKSGMVLVMNPKTGAVLASAVWPTFNPNQYAETREADRRNRILTDPFEPGSTFKVFVVAAALEEKLITPNTLIFCEKGAYKVSNHIVRDTRNYEDLTVSEIIKVSSNIGSVKIGSKLGAPLLHNYLTRFSFGAPTGISMLTGESSGQLRNSSLWHELDEANIAFGQGLSTTAIQMAMGVSSLANDGVLMRPYIVDSVINDKGEVIEKFNPQIVRQVVSPLTARQVGAMLRMAVMKGGTGYKAEVKGYPVAGKTGTAQKVDKGRKNYAAGKYVASFVGFAPYKNPELSILVVLDEPYPYYGGHSAAPVFKEIMEAALPILNIEPSDDEKEAEPVWPVLAAENKTAPGLAETKKASNIVEVKLKKNFKGSNTKLETPASVNAELQKASISPNFIARNEVVAEEGQMPNLKGLSMVEVLDVMSNYDLELNYSGSGWVKEQLPTAGEEVFPGDLAEIIFSDKL